MTKIALMGAGGKMGVRLATNLQGSRFDVAPVEISDRGRVVGTDGALRRACTLYGDTLTYLPLPSGASRSRAGDVNTCGTIAGSVSSSRKSDPELAVLWRRVSGTPPHPVCDAP